jgi:hypothetical protein
VVTRVPGDGRLAPITGDEGAAVGVTPAAPNVLPEPPGAGAVPVVPPRVSDGLAPTGPDWAVPVEPEAVFPPPTCAAPVESVTSLPLPDVPPASEAEAASPMIKPPTSKPACADPTCAVPVEPVDEFPPPTCAAPVESDAVLPPLPPIVSEAPALAVFPSAPADADGLELTPLTCTLPVEPLDVFPPPACTAPVELVAVLSPEPVMATGTDASTDTPDSLASADGVTLTGPV